MNTLDIILLCIAGAGFVKGLVDGVVKQVVSLIALIAAVLLCGETAYMLRSYIISLGIFPQNGITIISYILAFIMIVGLLKIAGNLLDRLIDSTPLSVLNHIGGGFIGFVIIILFMSLTFNIIEFIDPGSVLIPRQAKVESLFYQPLIEIVPTIFPSHLFEESWDNIKIPV